MGLKKRKYVYVKIAKDRYVKVRVFKSRAESSPDRYEVVGPVVKKPPFTAEVLDLEELPSEVSEKILAQYYSS